MSWGLEAASVRFGQVRALSDVTVATEPSTVTVVVGGDGAGKSTCLRALVGLVELSAGEARRPAKSAIGYLPATGGLYLDLTVEENLQFSARVYGQRGPAMLAKATAMLERIGLAETQGRLAGQLSGGMQRKLAVGIALLHEPSLVVLDEPTTGVDPLSRSEMWRIISRSAAGGAAVIVSTTYVNEAQRASSVMLLEGGRAIAVGSPSSIIEAIPGSLGVASFPSQPTPLSWRWGTTWRVWAPNGRLPDGVQPLRPGFEDAVVIASMRAAKEVRPDARAG